MIRQVSKFAMISTTRNRIPADELAARPSARPAYRRRHRRPDSPAGRKLSSSVWREPSPSTFASGEFAFNADGRLEMRNSRRLRGRPSCMRTAGDGIDDPREPSWNARLSLIEDLSMARPPGCGSIHPTAHRRAITVSSARRPAAGDRSAGRARPQPDAARGRNLDRCESRRADNNRDINQRSSGERLRTRLDVQPGHRAGKSCRPSHLESERPARVGGFRILRFRQVTAPAGRSCSESMAV